jgi:hypothetical protein
MQEKSPIGGLSFLCILFFLFLGLKLVKIIDWNWWYITSPLLFGLAVTSFMVTIPLFFIILFKIFR